MKHMKIELLRIYQIFGVPKWYNFITSEMEGFEAMFPNKQCLKEFFSSARIYKKIRNKLWSNNINRFEVPNTLKIIEREKHEIKFTEHLEDREEIKKDVILEISKEIK